MSTDKPQQQLTKEEITTLIETHVTQLESLVKHPQSLSGIRASKSQILTKVQRIRELAEMLPEILPNNGTDQF